MDVRVRSASGAFSDIFSQESGEILDIIVLSKALVGFVVSGMVGSIMDCLKEFLVTRLGNTKAMMTIDSVCHIHEQVTVAILGVKSLKSDNIVGWAIVSDFGEANDIVFPDWSFQLRAFIEPFLEIGVDLL